MNARTVAGSLATAAFLGCLSLASEAATIVESGHFGPSTQPYSVSALGFNSALGTLTGITVTFSGSATDQMTVTNHTGSSQNLSDASVTNGVVTFNNFDGTPSGKTVSVNTSDDYGFTPNTVAANSTTTVTSNHSTSFTDNFSVVGSDYSAYYGSSSYINFIDNGTFTGNANPGADGLTATASALVSGNWTVTYTYNATTTPEPGTLAMLAGFGTTGVGFLFRKRRISRSA